MIPETRLRPCSAVEKPRKAPPQREGSLGNVKEKEVFREDGNIFQNLVGFTDDHVNIVIIITKVS